MKHLFTFRFAFFVLFLLFGWAAHAVDILYSDGDLIYVLYPEKKTAMLDSPKKIDIQTATILESVIYDGEKYVVTEVRDWCFSDCFSLVSIDIPSSVTSLGDRCFSGCSSLVSIDIPSSVTSLGYACFEDCSSLVSIDIPSSVTELGEGCFYGCSSLVSIDIPSSVTSIGVGCFEGCTSLVSIDIPSSVTSIEEGCFVNCPSLSTISVDVDNPIFDSRENCNAIIETATNTIVTGCKETTIPNSVTSLGKFCFCYCSSLTSIDIPSSVTELGDLCFYGCSSLESVICRMDEPYKNSVPFWECPLESATLYVPAASLSAYQTTEPWSWFGKILSIDEYEAGINEVVDADMQISVRDGALCLENAPVGTPVSVYTPAGQLMGRYKATGSTMNFNLPRQNVYLIRVGDKTVKVGL